MKKIASFIALITMMLSTTLSADETNTQKIDGFYGGLGGGMSWNALVISKGNHPEDGNSTYNFKNASDNSGGYIIYAGYQINKIIAVEGSFTDYGSFEDTVTDQLNIKRNIKSDPVAGAVYANAGYTFANGLRPFGQLGFAYVNSNGVKDLSKLGIKDNYTSIHWGTGLEYAPKKLNGFGFRVAIAGDTGMDMNYEAADENGDLKTTTLMRWTNLTYISAQYKF